MTQTTDYKRGYSKGYSTGTLRGDKRAVAEHEHSKQVAERAERAEKAQGLGHCENCANYRKGCDNCAWGYCEAKHGAGTPWGTWIRGEGLDGSDGRVMVAMRFGCVLFKQREPQYGESK